MSDKQLLNQKYGMVISARGAGRLTAEKHEKMQGLRKAVESELYKKYAVYDGQKLVGYVISNEVSEDAGEYFDECEWVEI